MLASRDETGHEIRNDLAQAYLRTVRNITFCSLEKLGSFSVRLLCKSSRQFINSGTYRIVLCQAAPFHMLLKDSRLSASFPATDIFLPLKRIIRNFVHTADCSDVVSVRWEVLVTIASHHTFVFVVLSPKSHNTSSRRPGISSIKSVVRKGLAPIQEHCV
jgi:hypothetical protein